MAKKETPTPIKGTIDITSLHKPLAEKTSDRKVWSIGLGLVWLPYFTATNATGVTSIPHDALGAPLRLAREKDGTPRFSQSGRPVLRVNKELSDQIKMIRENFAYGLMVYADQVQKAMPDAYKAQVAAAQKAGAPIVQKDGNDLRAYVEALADAQAEANGEKTETPAAPVTETPNAVAEAEKLTERELVAA